MSPISQPVTLNEDLLARVTKLVARIILESTGHDLTLAPDEPLISSGHLDSMSMVSLVMAMQAEFGIDLDAADMSAERFESVRTIAALIAARRAP